MDILLLGKTGQVGRQLQRTLAPLGAVTAPGRDALDLRDPAALQDALRARRPDVIVNAAAYTAVDQAETDPQTASQVNAQAVAVLARYAKASQALLVHYSTDYVFDGAQSRPYTEDDPCHPLNVYGASKLAGEEAIHTSACDALILRCSWVYSPQGRNFLTTILQLARTRDSLDVIADQHGAPTPATLIAEVTALAIGRHRKQALPRRTYHLAAAGSTNWHAYARHIVAGATARGAALALAPERIRAIAARDYPAAARRPVNSRLDITALSRALDLQVAPWSAYVDQCLDELFPSAARP